jgi:glucokinase
VERLASGPYMAQDAAQRLEAEGNGKGAILRRLAEGDPQAITGKMLSEAAEQGDELAQEILKRGAAALGAGIANAANLVNPQKVVLGGGVTKAGDLWWTTLRQTVEQVTMPEVDVELVPAALGDDAPLWGAVALAEIGD